MILLENIQLPNKVLVDLTLEPNNHYVIIGKNGAGKSTLLKVLANLLKPLKGELLVDNIPLNKLPPLKRNKLISYMPQNFLPQGFMTVQDFILIGAIKPSHKFFIRHSKDDYQLAQKLLERLHIANLVTKDISKLSGGELTLVSFARVLMQRALFLLLDEVEAGLDYKYLSIYHSVIKELITKHGVIEVSHNPYYYLNLPENTKILAICNNKIALYNNSDLSSELLSSIYEAQIEIVELNGMRIPIFQDNYTYNFK